MAATVQLEPRDYVRALAKRWVFITLFTLTVTLAGGVYSLTVPTKYVAVARVLMRPQTPSVALVVGGREKPLAPQLSLETYAKLLTSSENAKKVAQRLAARTSGQRIIADPAEIVNALRARTEPPDVIAVEAEASSPEQAMAFANEAADSFVIVVGDFHRAAETAARQFVEEQLARTSEDIDQISRQLEALREQFNVTTAAMPAPGEETTLQYVSLLQRYTDSLKRLDGQLSAARAELKHAEAELAKTDPYLVEDKPIPNPLRESLNKQLVSYQAALAEMLGRYTEDHPAVQDLKDKIAALEKQIQSLPAVVQETSSRPNPKYSELMANVDQARQRVVQLEAERASLQRTVAELTGQAKEAARLLQRTEELTARLSLLRDMKRQLVVDLQVHKMNEAIKSEVAAVLDRAVTARARTPRLSKALLFSFMLGLAASCALAIFFELLDDSIHDPDDLRRHTDLAYLGMVPRMEPLDDPLVVVAAPKSPYAEAYRSIRSQINFRLWEKPGKILLVTSALAGEGKTLTVANLAAAYAQAGQSVMVVDTDLRRPAVHQLFHAENTVGLTNVVVGEAKLSDVIIDTGIPGLRLVASGPLPPNPAELLESEGTREIIQRAGEMADIVLLDSPPCLVISDAAVLGAYVDQVILVVQAGQVNARELGRTREILEAGRAPILGAILNRVPLTRGGYYYYYYYYYYYGYGQQAEPKRAET